MADLIKASVSCVKIAHGCHELIEGALQIVPFELKINRAMKLPPNLEEIVTTRPVVINQAPVDNNLGDRSSIWVEYDELLPSFLNNNSRVVFFLRSTLRIS